MVSEESLRFIAELVGGVAARRSRSTFPRPSPRSTTASASTARRPAAYLDDLGLLTERALLAHGVWLDDEELELIAERGATVVTNPAANMKLAVGKIFDWPSARAAGVRVGLGTDGAGSNDSLDLIADLKLFALAQRHAAADATAIAVDDAWAIATGAKAPLLGATPLAVGEPADFLLLDPAAPELAIGEPHRRPRLRRRPHRGRHRRRRRPGPDARRRTAGARRSRRQGRERATRLGL